MSLTKSRCPDHPDAPHALSILGETYCLECEWFTFDHEEPCPLATPWVYERYLNTLDELECVCEED